MIYFHTKFYIHNLIGTLVITIKLKAATVLYTLDKKRMFWKLHTLKLEGFSLNGTSVIPTPEIHIANMLEFFVMGN
jgi:hypothetical protein